MRHKKTRTWLRLVICTLAVMFARHLFPEYGLLTLAASPYTSEKFTAASDTWSFSNTFVTGGGWIKLHWSLDRNNYRHQAHTSGYSRNGSGGGTPIRVKVIARSYETSDIHLSPCNDRFSALEEAIGEVDGWTSTASVFACGGSPTGGWHYYYGEGKHWVGSYYGETFTQS